MITDTRMWAADVPSTCTGMRGLASAEVTLTGPDLDLHSGSFGGGVPNPLHAMAGLLAGLHDEAGRVQVPGFYDGVLALTAQERELFARLPFDEKQFLADAGHSGAASGEEGFSTLERIWARPTAEVNGIWGGYTGPGGKTIVPSDAHVKLSFRLVADQDPADVRAAVDEYVPAHTPAGMTAEVTEAPGVRPSLVPIDSPACWPAGGRCSGRSAARCCSPARAAAAPRRTWPRSWPRRWSSSASACPTTRSTRRTRPSTWPGCSAGRRGVGLPVGGTRRSAGAGAAVTSPERSGRRGARGLAPGARSTGSPTGATTRTGSTGPGRTPAPGSWSSSTGQALVRAPPTAGGAGSSPAPGQAPPGTRFLLGQDAAGVVYFGVERPAAGLASGRAGPSGPAAGHRGAPAALRDVGPMLGRPGRGTAHPRGGPGQLA